MLLPLGSSQRSFAVDGVTQSVDDTSKELQTNRDVDDGTSTFNNVALFDELVVTEDDDTDVVGLQVKRHSLFQKMYYF